MISHRQRGLVSVYAFTANGVAMGVLLMYAQLIRFVPHVELLPQVNLLPYCVAVFVGMVASTGYVRHRGYTLHRIGWFGGLALALRQVFFVATCIFALMFATKDREISRLFLGTYLILLSGVLTVLHACFPRLLAQMLFAENAQLPTVFIGRGGDLENIDDWIENRGHLGIKPVGFLSETKPTRAERAIAPYLGRIENLPRVLREKQVRQVILLEWMLETETVENIVEMCEAEGCRFLIHNNLDARFARPLIPVQEGGRHFLALQEEPLEDPLNRGAKRVLDIAISLPVVVFILPPLCLLVWLFQRTQAPGPLFFVKPRGGQNRREFKMFKFRSMYMKDHDINQQATATDCRIFPFGKFLRRTSLDEFPQFINVLLGTMSVVGPRPHLPQHDTDFSQISRVYRVRALVKPGITGLAQINGYRGEITDPEKLHHRVYWDLYYVTNWSLGLDIQIILRTAAHVMFPPKSAY
jgi:exopolysaccharide biosynthesis polyprenyl glycosylphosphotransferase